MANAGDEFIDDADAELFAQALIAQKMVRELIEVKKARNPEPDLFVESWLKAHVYDATDDFLESTKNIFSQMYIDMVKRLGTPVEDWRNK